MYKAMAKRNLFQPESHNRNQQNKSGNDTKVVRIVYTEKEKKQ